MKIALYQARTGIDPAVNRAALVTAVREAAAGGAAMLFTPEMSGLLDQDRSRAMKHLHFESAIRCSPPSGPRRGGRPLGASRLAGPADSDGDRRSIVAS